MNQPWFALPAPEAKPGTPLSIQVAELCAALLEGADPVASESILGVFKAWCPRYLGRSLPDLLRDYDLALGQELANAYRG